MAQRCVNCLHSINLMKGNAGLTSSLSVLTHGRRKETVKPSKGGKNRFAEGGTGMEKTREVAASREEEMITSSIGLTEHVEIFSYGIAICLEFSRLIFSSNLICVMQQDK